MSDRVLVVDDEPAIAESVSYALQQEGYEVDTVGDGENALAAARTGAYAVVVLDLILPRLSGIDVCATLRAESDIPILVLTARDAEVDRVRGLELGADDYVTKPFSVAELVSRVRAILRRRALDRSTGSRSAVREVNGVAIDFTAHRVTVDGRPVALTPSEFKLLALLTEEPDRVFSRREIMERLWATTYVGDERACDVHVAALRRKVERIPSRPSRVVTVRGVGYRFAAG